MNNEELDSQLSAMFDDELPEQQCELLARRLARDENLKARWGRYATIGAAIRKEQVVRVQSQLASRISAAIASEPSLLSEPAGTRQKFASPAVRRWVQPVAGAALAASVAALAIFVLRAQAPLGAAPDAQTFAQSNAQSTATQESPAPEGTTVLTAESSSESNNEPDSYTVPQSVEPLSVVPSTELANYVVAHSEYSTPLSRLNLRSAFVASEPGTAGGSSESEEQVENGTLNAEQAH
jgi:negative regulator of sigma E activity